MRIPKSLDASETVHASELVQWFPMGGVLGDVRLHRL